MNHRILVGSSLLALCLACGGSPFTVNGTLRGSSLKAGDAVSANGAIQIGSATMNAALAVLSNASGLCGLASAGRQPKSAQYLTLVVSDRNTNSAPTTAGIYTIWLPGSGAQPTKLAFAQYSQTDANCQPVGQFITGTSGTVTVTSVSNGDLSGNFDITFNSGDHVTGSFSAKNCNALISALSGNPACG